MEDSFRAKKQPSIHYIFTRINHHSDHSGYDQLTKYIPGRLVGTNKLHTLLDFVPERVLAQIRRSAGEWYNSNALKQELQNIPDFFLKSQRIYHFLYGEDTFHYSSYLNPRKSNKFVASYHNPPAKFLKINRGSRHLQALDALVIVASNQEELFKNLINPGRVHLIPHGVDTNFFKPGETIRRQGGQCLFVGSHLRDLATFREVIKLLNKKAPEISFTAVTFEANFKYFEGLKNVRLYSSISEKQLLNFYTTSDILLLPLLDSTANNTILEAMACGLPTITNAAGGIGMYLPQEAGMLLPLGEASLMAQKTIELIYDPALRAAMSHAARSTAESFDWAIIAKKMQLLYQHITE